MLCAQRTFPHHVPPVHILVTCYRTAYSYVSVPVSHVSLPVLLWTNDSSMITFPAYTYFFWIVNSSMLTIPSYAYSFQLVCRVVIPGLWLIPWLAYLLRLFVLVSLSLIYIRLEMGIRPSSSIYFATTLQVWPARSLVLSSSLLARWSRLLLCNP